MDRVTKFLNGNEEIKKVIPSFIDIFVKYYGEDRREEIEEKFSNLLCIGYQTPDAIQRGLYILEGEKTDELLGKVFKNINIPLNTIKGTLTFNNKDLMPINCLYELVDLYQLGEAGRKDLFYEGAFINLNSSLHITKEEFEELVKTKQLPERFKDKPDIVKNYIMDNIDYSRMEQYYKSRFSKAQNLLQTIIPDINEDNFEELLNHDTINELVSVSDKYEDAYEKYLEELTSLQEEVKEIEDLKTSLNNKFYKEFIRENQDLFPIYAKRKVEKYVNSDETTLISSFIDIVGSTLSSTSLIESFSEEADKILNDPDESIWRKNTIKENRVNYYKAMGLELGNNYDDYLKYGNLDKINPSKERVKSFLESKNKYLNKFNNMFYTSLKRHKKILEEIDSIDFIDKNYPINAATYTHNCPFISPNFIKTENGYQLYPMLFIDFSNYNTTCLDHDIVHELNHVLETSIGLVGEHEYEMFCGWDIETDRINAVPNQKEVDTLEERKVRPYELFNEIINEMISQEISKIIEEENLFVFDDKNNFKYTYTTDYDYTKFLVKDFFYEFRDSIIKSRSNGNIQIIYDEVGKENFDALNELFHIYFEHFGGMKKVDLYSSLQEGEDTEQTRIYHELTEKRDIILDNMRKYRDSHKSEKKEATI